MKQIYVALEIAGKTLPVGVIRFDSAQGFGFFTYLPKYDGPPLDPINLDYRKPVDPRDRLRRGERTFVVDVANNPSLLHQVFVDAMPGQWGMAVLQAEYPEIRQMKDADRLYWMGSRTVGAISMFVERRSDEQPVRGLDELEEVRKKCAEFQKKLERMGLDGVRNPAVATHGGVMPKASYEDAQGRHWMAKFDKPGDGIQFCALEHAAMKMAQLCGVTTPETKVLADGMGGSMFLSARYDREGGQRYHKVSFMTLTGAKEAGSGDYRDMFRILEAVCDPVAWPAQRDELLRRMALNIGLNITDDHLRNHEMRLSDAGAWELSPAFDLVPIPGGAPHQCAIFGNARASINLQDPKAVALWSKIALELGSTPEYVLGLVGDVAKKIEAHWPGLVASSGLNRFNQMQALVAAEVGCGVPFPEQAKVVATVPLTEADRRALLDASAIIAKAMHVLRGAHSSPAEELNASKALMLLNEDLPRMVHVLRRAGQESAAELLMTAPVAAAAKAVLEPGKDHSMWRDLEDAGRSLLAASAGARPAKRPTPT